MMFFRNWVSTLASAESFVAVTRVGTLVIVSSLVWQTLRAERTLNTKEVSVM